MELTFKIDLNGVIRKIPDKVVEESSFIKNLIKDVPEENNILIEWFTDQVNLDLLTQDIPCDNLKVLAETIKLADYLGLDLDLLVDKIASCFKAKTSWFNFFSSYEKEFNLLKSSKIPINCIVKILQRVDLTDKVVNSFLSSFYQGLNREEAFLNLGWDELNLRRSNCHRVIIHGNHYNKIKVLVTKHKDVLKEWIGVYNNNIVYLTPNGFLKDHIGNILSNDKYRKLFSVYNSIILEARLIYVQNILMLEREDGRFEIWKSNKKEIIDLNLSLEFISYSGYGLVFICSDKTGQNLFYLWDIFDQTKKLEIDENLKEAKILSIWPPSPGSFGLRYLDGHIKVGWYKIDYNPASNEIDKLSLVKEVDEDRIYENSNLSDHYYSNGRVFIDDFEINCEKIPAEWMEGDEPFKLISKSPLVCTLLTKKGKKIDLIFRGRDGFWQPPNQDVVTTDILKKDILVTL